MTASCRNAGSPSSEACLLTRSYKLNRHVSPQAGTSRVLTALSALLASWLVAMTVEVHAEQISVEESAKAAGLAVKTGNANVNGVTIYYRDIGPRAESVVLLHGLPETGDTFAPAVAALGKRYRLIVPDLRGTGLSHRPLAGYEKKTLATDVKELMDHLKIARAHVIGHDIGARVAYAFAVQYPERLLSLTVAEAFIEGLAGTAEFKRFAPTNPRTQHFARFARVDEALSEHQGKEEELILSFMNSRSKSREFTGDDVARYTASLKRDGGLSAAFMNYEAFDRDATFAASADTSRLSRIPALAIVCQNPVGNVLERQLVAAGLKNLKGVMLNGCTHWIYEENPNETLPVIIDFLGGARDVP
jgi:pimeloyl-ACP methyl ester carboxylesterase